jgi:hypothetical protein
MNFSVENRDEPLLENILSDVVHDILESEDINCLFDKIENEPPELFGCLDNDDPPSQVYLSNELVATDHELATKNSEIYEKQLKNLTGLEDKELSRKRLYVDKNFSNLVEFMLEDTLFNLMEEATYEEFDLTQAPKTYIRK